MEGTAFFPLPEELRITEISREEAALTVKVLSERTSARCPLCGEESVEVHSRYQRRLKDMPSIGQAVRLHLTVRKFFCRNPACQCKIFTERLPAFVEPWAQMTLRLKQAIQAIGLSTSGSLGTRLAARLGIATSWMTILRRIMQLPTEGSATVTALGLDDFSFRRGRNFGTILVDLSTHRVIDLLPERKVESAAAWMRSHPEIRYVSRDRGNDYAQATREGAPQAIAVADRFHLTKNLVEAIEPLVAHSYKQLRKALLPLPEPRSPEAKEWRQAVTPARQHQRFTRLTTNQERYERMGELQKRGVPQQEIARQLGVTVRTLQNWNKRGACPGSTQRRRRRSIFDLYAPSVLSHWQQGHRDVTLLFQEIQAQGYPGKIRTVYRFIQTLKQNPAQFPALSVLDRVSVQEAVWLIARPFEDLKADERVDLEELCQASPTLSILHTLVQSFGRLVRKREGHRLEDWKKQVRESGLPEMQSFVKGLERDREAVLAGLTESYSNGMTEGFVNKLKLIKRQGYGRASFPLLRQRVLVNWLKVRTKMSVDGLCVRRFTQMFLMWNTSAIL